MAKKIFGLAFLVIAVLFFAGCESKADVASKNLSKAAAPAKHRAQGRRHDT